MAGKLRANGTNITDESGNIVKLLSVNMDHNEYIYGFLGTDDFTRMKLHGGNCFEINGMRVRRMMPTRGNIDPTYLSKLDNIVNLAEAAQMHMIFTFDDMSYEVWDSTIPDWMLNGHGYGNPPYSEATYNQAVLDFWDTTKTIHNDNRQSFADMWAYLANRYKDKQYIMFGIMNEPFSHTDINANGGATYSHRMGYSYATVIEQIVDAMHAVSDNLIFVDRPYVWYYSDVQPVNRAGIVWEDHRYVDPPGGVAQIASWKSGVDGMIARFMVDFGKPFYLGEYGPFPTNMTGWLDVFTQQTNYLQGKMAGRAWHQWGALNGEYYNTFTLAESESLLNAVYSTGGTVKYVFQQWQDGSKDNPKTIQL